LVARQKKTPKRVVSTNLMTQALANTTPAVLPPKKVRRRRIAQAQGNSRELYYRPEISGWTPERVESARDGADAGIMMELADLIETMCRDARISGVISTRTHGMLGLPLEFMGGADEARTALGDMDQSETPNAQWWQMHDESEVAKLLKWGLMCGVGIAQRIELPRLVGQPHRYKIETWSPRWLSYYHYGYENGNAPEWRVLTQNGNESILPGDGQWIMFLPYGARRPWTEGLWTQLAFPWLLKHFSLEDRANFGEVLGSPVWVGTTAHGGTEKQRNTFLSQLRRLGKNGKIVLPQGWDLQLREAAGAGKTGDVFDNQIKQSNEEITIALAGQLVTTEGTTGFSAGNVQETIHQNLLRFDAIRIASCLREQSLEPWALWNYGTRAAAPFPKWNTEKPEDVTEVAEGMNKLGEAVTSLNQALQAGGIEVDANKLVEKFGVPIRTKKKDAAVAQDTSLNGAQISSMLEVIASVVQGQLPRDSALQIIVSAFPVTVEQAEKILGSVGSGFVPKVQNAV
jgi:phage gp29-like protein